MTNHDANQSGTQFSENLDREYPERLGVVQIHEPVVREHTRPKEGREPTPLWLLFFYLLIMGIGGWYLGMYSGAFRRDIYNEDPAVLAERAKRGGGEPKEIDPMVLGKRVYARCSSCHQADGQGLAETYPPLAGSDWVTGPPEVFAGILIRGIQGPLEVKGVTYNEEMPAWSNLSNEDLAAVMTYVRGSWDNSATAVQPPLVERVRKYLADDRGHWDPPALEQFRDDVKAGRIRFEPTEQQQTETEGSDEENSSE